MMIIEDGRYPDRNKTRCKGCGALFQYYDTEINSEITTPDEASFLGGIGVHEYIRCPQCGNVCTITCELIETESFLTKLKKKWTRRKAE